MSFGSVDIHGESSWQRPSSKMSPEALAAQTKELRKVRMLLDILLDLPVGAYSLFERLTIIAFDPNTFSIHPKKLNAFNPKTAETYVVYDTVFKHAFFPDDLFDKAQVRALQSACEAHFGADMVWVAVDPESWNELHQQMITQSAALQNQEDEAEDEELSVNEDELRRKIQSLIAMEDLLNFFEKSFNKIKELEEALFQSLKEKSKELDEEKSEQLKFKELLRNAIKEEVTKERLLVEEMKRRQPQE